MSREKESLLLIDAGNSRVKWAVWNGTLGPQNALEWSELASDDLAIDAPDSRFRIVAANVAGDRFDRLINAGLREKANSIQTIESERSACGVTNGYREPSQMGSDRWAALIGAWHHTQTATLVVDAGTAATIDMLDTGGEHLGGMIVPGYQLMIDSLLGQTSDIARVTEHGRPDAAGMEGRSTGEAISAGALYALLSLVDNTREHLIRRSGIRPAVVLTGGHAARLHRNIDGADWIPDLVLRGLTILAGKQP